MEQEEEEDGAATDVDSQKKGKCAVIKTSTRQTIFLPVVGLVDVEELKPGDIIGVNKDSYLVLEKLPEEYDSRIKVTPPSAKGYRLCVAAVALRLPREILRKGGSSVLNRRV